MHYKIEGLAYRKIGDEQNLVVIDEVFEDGEACVARKRCFEAYQSYLDVFLLGIGKKYSNHEQAVADLQDFFVKDKAIVFDELENDNFIDIKLYLNEKEQEVYKDFKELEGEILIHSIGSMHQSNLSKSMCLDGLLLEKKYYDLNEFFCKKHLVKDKKGNEIYNTPIDYSDFEYEKDIW